jgi:hypothetical protein
LLDLHGLEREEKQGDPTPKPWPARARLEAKSSGTDGGDQLPWGGRSTAAPSCTRAWREESEERRRWGEGEVNSRLEKIGRGKWPRDAVFTAGP